MVEILILSAGCLSLITLSLIFYKESVLKSLTKISKESDIKFLVYGDITKKHEKKISHYLPALKKILSDSGTVSKEVELKISSDEEKLKCQIRFVAGACLGQIIENDGQETLLDGLRDLKKIIEKKELDITLVDFFSGYGGVGYSEISFEIPL